jgi:hypothetical protein
LLIAAVHQQALLTQQANQQRVTPNICQINYQKHQHNITVVDSSHIIVTIIIHPQFPLFIIFHLSI